jgi:mRNA interferase MazF
MKQGEIWYSDLNPIKGSEQSGLRPVAIVSGNLLNQHLPVVIVVPLTSKVKRYKGNPVLMPSKENGLDRESELLVFHIRSVSKERLVRKIGHVTQTELSLVVKTLNDILKY